MSPEILAAVMTLICAVVGFFIVRTLNHIDASVNTLTASVGSLNQQMGTVVTEMAYQRRDIDKHGDEIEKIKERILQGMR